MSYAEVLLNQPVVIDNGSGTIKAGIAGEEVPKTVFSSLYDMISFVYWLCYD